MDRAAVTVEMVIRALELGISAARLSDLRLPQAAFPMLSPGPVADGSPKLRAIGLNASSWRGALPVFATIAVALLYLAGSSQLLFLFLR